MDVKEQRQAPKLKGLPLALLSFQALGIIYSDIGTSPLYTLNGIWPTAGPAPPTEDVIGGISAIIWFLMLIPLVKYIFISLYFGTGEGEGGTFALYQGLFPPPQDDYEVDRTLTVDYDDYKKQSKASNRKKHQISQVLNVPLLIWCLFGTSLTMSDGIFTPIVSVTSAVSGISVAKPSVANDVIPISIAFLVALFLVQQFGTSSISFLFAPIAFLWFFALAATGIYNITFYPGIFRAFDPSRAVLLFVRTGNYDLLTGVILALTGCEAVFANLGQFNAASIQISFVFVVFPSIVLAYLGQGARLIDDPSVLENMFYKTIPGPTNGGLYWVIFVLGILATLVASQALISATFSLFQQVINMKSFPPLRMVCTSDKFQGQVYIPVVNWVLMALCIIIVAVFNNPISITNAYGFAVATVMISTAILISVSMYYVKQWHWIISLAFLALFGFLDALLWGACLKKVPAGAWVPLMIGLILAIAMLFWTWGKKLEDAFDGANRQNILRFISAFDSESPNRALSIVSQASDGDEKSLTEKMELARIPNCAIFHKFSRGPGVPHTFVGFVRQWPGLPKVVVFMSVCIVPFARVPDKDRYAVRKVQALHGIYGATYYLGFRDEFHIEHEILANHICEAEQVADPDVDKAWLAEIRTLVRKSTHIVPHYRVVSTDVKAGFLSPIFSYFRRILVEEIYRCLAAIFPETGNWLMPADEIIHVGINAFI